MGAFLIHTLAYPMRSDRLNEVGCDLQGRGRVRARLFCIVAPQSCKSRFRKVFVRLE